MQPGGYTDPVADSQTPATTRRQAADEMRHRLIEAAIAQLASEGMRGLTHRKVEHRAGVSQGLAKYHFGSLDGLITAVLAHLVDVELGRIFLVSPQTQAAARNDPGAVSDVVGQAQTLWEQLTARPDLVKAWFELYLFAFNRPDLQQTIRGSRERLTQRVAESLASAEDPEAGARMLLALVDGLLVHQLSAPEPVIDRMAPHFIVLAGAAALQPPVATGVERT